MDLAHHRREDRLITARLSGILTRHSGTGDDTAAAVAELHTVSTDPHLLAHAITIPDHLKPRGQEILAAAGADMAELAVILAALPKGGDWLGRMADNTR